MPRIDPQKLLYCLKVLLAPNGGIRSELEVKRLAQLMAKYSKKLVSKCIYIQILKCTETELLGQFMGLGGWSLTHLWLADGIKSENWPLVQEILELLLLCPVDVQRLRSNSSPKMVKILCKDGGSEGVRILATKLVEQWLKVVKSETRGENGTSQAIHNKTQIDESSTSSSTVQKLSTGTTKSLPSSTAISGNTENDITDKMSTESDDPLDVPDTVPTIVNKSPNVEQKKPESQLVYKLVMKDGKTVLEKVDTNKTTIKETSVSTIKKQENNETIKEEQSFESEKSDSNELKDIKENKEIKDIKDIKDVKDIKDEKEIKDIKDIKEFKKEEPEKNIKEEGKSNEDKKEKEKHHTNKDKEKHRDHKSSSSSSHRKSSSKSSSSIKASSSKSKSSSSHRSSTDSKDSKSRDSDKEKHKSSSISSNSSISSSKDKSKDREKEKTRSKDKDSKRDKDKDKEKDKEKLSRSKDKDKRSDKDDEKEKDQAEKDRETLSKIAPTTLEKLGKIPRKPRDESTASNSPTSITIPSKKASISIEIRKDTDRPKTVKTYNSQFRSHGLTDEAPPPPSRKNLKKPTPQTVPGTSIPSNLSLKRSSPVPFSKDKEVAPPAEKKPKIDMTSNLNVSNEKPGAIKLIAPKPKHQVGGVKNSGHTLAMVAFSYFYMLTGVT